MRILISAYACFPSTVKAQTPDEKRIADGESFLGWNLATQIARFHKVWVITDSRNKEGIERGIKQDNLKNIKFIYITVPLWRNKNFKNTYYLHSYYNRVPSDATFLTTSNLAVAKNAFFDANGFDTTFPLAAGEDREFCARWRRQGRNLAYIPEAIVLHAHNLSFRSFIRQHFNYGQGAYYYHKIQAEAAGQSIHVEPVSFYWRLLRYAWYKKVQSGQFWISALMALSQVANAVGFFYTMVSRRNRV